MLCSQWVEIWPLHCTSMDEMKQPFLLREAVYSKLGSSWLQLKRSTWLSVLEYTGMLRWREFLCGSQQPP